jgi:chromosome partitioning protein
MEDGETVLILDCDPTQASAMLWGNLRSGAAPLVKPLGKDEIDKALRWATRNGFTFVVLDMPGRDGVDATSVLSRADFVIVPAQPTVLDLQGSYATRRAIADLGVPQSVLLNRVRSATAARARRFREKYGESGRVLDALLSDRVAFADTFAAGRSVLEWPGESARAASVEVRAAYRCIRELAEAHHG